MKQRAKWFTGLIVIAVMLGQFASAAEDPAVTRTRNQVLMLDDLYKTVIVLVTKHYVTSPAIVSAATAGKLIFAAMKDKGMPLKKQLKRACGPGRRATKRWFQKVENSIFAWPPRYPL